MKPFFPPITQDAVVKAAMHMQLGMPLPDNQDIEEALALACQAHVEAIDGMDADQTRPEGWSVPTEPEDGSDWVSGGTHPVGWKLDDGGTGHILSLVCWALWKGGVEEPNRSTLLRELWSGLRPGTVASVNMDLKAHRDHRMPDEQRAAEERLLAQLRASHRKIRELADDKLVGRD